jgi:hypothetical protein
MKILEYEFSEEFFIALEYLIKNVAYKQLHSQPSPNDEFELRHERTKYHPKRMATVIDWMRDESIRIKRERAVKG